MRALDRDMIMDLYGAAASVSADPENTSHLFAIRKEESVIVLNTSILIEWPIELVDTTIPEYNKLLRAARLSAQLSEKLANTPWGKVFTNKELGEIFECQEVEPEDEDTFSYRAPTGQVFSFNRHYMGIVNKIWPPYIIDGMPSPAMETTLHIRFGPQPPNRAPALLVITANGKRRGALACSEVR